MGLLKLTSYLQHLTGPRMAVVWQTFKSGKRRSRGYVLEAVHKKHAPNFRALLFDPLYWPSLKYTPVTGLQVSNWDSGPGMPSRRSDRGTSTVCALYVHVMLRLSSASSMKYTTSH